MHGCFHLVRLCALCCDSVCFCDSFGVCLEWGLSFCQESLSWRALVCSECLCFSSVYVSVI